MEITVNIPKNDYVQPTEVRQEVVQYICDAFLSTCVWRIFHPERQSAYRGKTLYVMVSKRSGKAYGFGGYKAFVNLYRRAFLHQISMMLFILFIRETLRSTFRVH